jgi:hypothetical protein
LGYRRLRPIHIGHWLGIDLEVWLGDWPNDLEVWLGDWPNQE